MERYRRCEKTDVTGGVMKGLVLSPPAVVLQITLAEMELDLPRKRTTKPAAPGKCEFHAD